MDLRCPLDTSSLQDSTCVQVMIETNILRRMGGQRRQLGARNLNEHSLHLRLRVLPDSNW